MYMLFNYKFTIISNDFLPLTGNIFDAFWGTFNRVWYEKTADELLNIFFIKEIFPIQSSLQRTKIVKNRSLQSVGE